MIVRDSSGPALASSWAVNAGYLVRSGSRLDVPVFLIIECDGLSVRFVIEG